MSLVSCAFSDSAARTCTFSGCRCKWTGLFRLAKKRETNVIYTAVEFLSRPLLQRTLNPSSSLVFTARRTIRKKILTSGNLFAKKNSLLRDFLVGLFDSTRWKIYICILRDRLLELWFMPAPQQNLFRLFRFYGTERRERSGESVLADWTLPQSIAVISITAHKLCNMYKRILISLLDTCTYSFLNSPWPELLSFRLRGIYTLSIRIAYRSRACPIIESCARAHVPRETEFWQQRRNLFHAQTRRVILLFLFSSLSLSLSIKIEIRMKSSELSHK